MTTTTPPTVGTLDPAARERSELTKRIADDLEYARRTITGPDADDQMARCLVCAILQVQRGRPLELTVERLERAAAWLREQNAKREAA